jgi:hypothetical protein
MKQKPLTLLKVDEVRSQLKLSTPEGVISIIEKQVERAIEAARRIEEEGVVVRDMKGSVIPHPAIQIEMAAHKMIVDLMVKHKVIKR